jgi:uncharacterized integral membrane protein (TIGR00698 family)
MSAPTNRVLPLAADLYGDLLEPPSAARAGWREHGRGLAIAALAALAAAYLSDHYHAPIMLMGLLIGLAFNFLNVDARLSPGLGFASRSLLRWGIVLMGLQVTFAQIAGLGLPAFAAIVAMIALVIASGVVVGRATGMGRDFGLLAGGAVAICGASAALAIASVLGDRRVSQAQLTLVLVTVSAASALAMVMYPALAHMLHLGDAQAGFLMGASIHDVAQALGAGYAYSPAAGQTASIVKLTRVALLAPVLGVMALATRGKPGAGATRRIELPWFVAGFFALSALHSLVPLPAALLGAAAHGATACLLIAVVATGIRSPLTKLVAQGWRPALPIIAATVTSFLLALGAIMVGVG